MRVIVKVVDLIANLEKAKAAEVKKKKELDAKYESEMVTWFAKSRDHHAKLADMYAKFKSVADYNKAYKSVQTTVYAPDKPYHRGYQDRVDRIDLALRKLRMCQTPTVEVKEKDDYFDLI